MLALHDCAAVLVEHGFDVNLDDQQENLVKFSLSQHLQPESSTSNV